MAIAFIQAQNAGNQVGPTVTCAFNDPLTYANTGFVTLGYSNNGVFCTTVLDDIGNSYSLLKRATGTDRVSEVWIANGLVAGLATISAFFPTAKSGIGIAVLEYAPESGTIFALDQQNDQQSVVNVTSYPHGSITTTINDELILTVAHTSTNVTAPVGYTLRSNLALSGNVNVMDRIVSATETTNPTPTGAATTYVALVVSLSGVVDTSGIQEDQQGREVLNVTITSSVFAQLDQMAREILYPFTVCNPEPPPHPEQQKIRRQRRGLLPSSPDQRRLKIPVLELLCRTGIGDSGTPDPQVMLRISYDGGKTWGPERWRSAGAVGRYANRVRWLRAVGLYRNAVFEITVTDPVDWQFLDLIAPQGIDEGSS